MEKAAGDTTGYGADGDGQKGGKSWIDSVELSESLNACAYDFTGQLGYDVAERISGENISGEDAANRRESAGERGREADFESELIHAGDDERAERAAENGGGRAKRAYAVPLFQVKADLERHRIVFQVGS